MVELEEVLKEYSKKLKFNQLFLRDLAITNKGFFYFLISFFFCATSLNFIMTFLLNYTGAITPNVIYPTIIITALLSIFLSGFIIDRTKNRVQLFLLSASLVTLGFFLMIIEGIFTLFGLSLITFFTGTFLIDLIIILIHESSILNRGRLFGYCFFFSFLFSLMVIFFTIDHLFSLFIIQFVIMICLYFISRVYKYKETEERLRTTIKFTDLFGSLNITGYFFAVLTLAFVLGNSYLLEYGLNIITPLFIILFISSFLVVGISLDNLGRKWTFATSVLITSAIILFARNMTNIEIYISIFFGISLPTSLMIIFTFTGDFSTERNIIRYRGRLTSIFLLTLIGGFAFGVLMNYAFTNLYLKDPSLFFWIPSLLNGLSPFLLILLLVWIIPLPEILTAKESDWKESLKNIYVFNSASVCLFTQNFKPNVENSNILSEDLIAGGFSGILSLLSEITNERKHLRIIDKQGVKIYFAYGKSIITALIATKNLPVLFKKLELFTKAFEKKFEKNLLSFYGKINAFQDASHLVMKYFS